MSYDDKRRNAFQLVPVGRLSHTVEITRSPYVVPQMRIIGTYEAFSVYREAKHTSLSGVPGQLTVHAADFANRVLGNPSFFYTHVRQPVYVKNAA
jgi:hypothetical protein